MSSFIAAMTFHHSPGEPFEELAHGYEVQLVGAVEDHCLDGQGLPQVLGGLRLPCPCWTRRSPTELQVQGPCEGQVASKGKRVCLGMWE